MYVLFAHPTIVVIDSNGMISDMLVAVLVVQGVFDTGLSVVLDTLAIANELASAEGDAAPFDVRLTGVRKRVHTQQGFLTPARSFEELERTHGTPQLVIVPALGDKTPELLEAALKRRDVRDARRALVRAAAGGARLAAACTGTYVLASSGLLDGHTATTTWWLASDFRQRFPAVHLDESKMVVEAGPHLTAGAALAHVDLALWLIRQHSPALARATARYLLIDGRPSQTAYAMLDHLAHTDPLIERFERWTRAHLRDFTMPAAARAIGASERTLQRRLRRSLGRTPIAYVRDLRVEQAIYLLQTTDDGVDEIAEAVGYQGGVTLRTLLRTKTGRGIREIRRGP